MRKNFMLKIVFFLLACLVSLPNLHSGIVMTGSEESRISSVLIDGNLLRIDLAADEDGLEGSLIYGRDEDGDRLVIIDVSEKSYYVITSSDMEAIKKQVEEAVRMIEEMISEIPEEDRKEAEPILMGMVPPEYAGFFEMMNIEKEVVLKDRDVPVGEWRADRYEIFHNGEKVTEAWFAGAEQFGLGARDFEVLREFDEFLEVPAPGMVPGFLFSEVDVEDSFPLRIVDFGDDDERSLTLEIIEFRREQIDPAEFRVPEGYSRGALPL